ncbi:MAG: M16 family metallopeptidase [Acidobacteriota bacterium]
MITKSKLLTDVQIHRLDNGLTVLTREDHSVPIVASMIWYRVGSRFEKPGYTGISHFLEHMMFKGTDRYAKGEIDFITARNGGSNNAFTSNDYTAYYFNFASDRWTCALEIEAERMRNNRFDPDEFELERQVILEELKMDLDHPWGALRQAVEINSFEQHPYRHPVIGLYEDLVRISLEQMIGYYRQFYAPNNAALVITGDFDTPEALHRVEDLFGPLPPEEITEVLMPIEPERREQVRLEIRKPARVQRILMALPAPSVRHREHFAVQILDKILSEGKLSRFYRRLIERQRVASLATSEFGETFDPYLFFIRLELQPDADIETVQKMVFEELEQLRQESLSEQELERAKNQCIIQLLSGLETPLDQAVQIGLLETLYHHEYWHTYIDEIRSLDSEEVRKVAWYYFSPERATLGVGIRS